MMLPGCVGVLRAILACVHQFLTGVSTSKRSAGADKNTVFSKHLGPLYALLLYMSRDPLYSVELFQAAPLRLTFRDSQTSRYSNFGACRMRRSCVFVEGFGGPCPPVTSYLYILMGEEGSVPLVHLLKLDVYLYIWSVLNLSVRFLLRK